MAAIHPVCQRNTLQHSQRGARAPACLRANATARMYQPSRRMHLPRSACQARRSGARTQSCQRPSGRPLRPKRPLHKRVLPHSTRQPLTSLRTVHTRRRWIRTSSLMRLSGQRRKRQWRSSFGQEAQRRRKRLPSRRQTHAQRVQLTNRRHSLQPARRPTRKHKLQRFWHSR